MLVPAQIGVPCKDPLVLACNPVNATRMYWLVLPARSGVSCKIIQRQAALLTVPGSFGNP